MWIVKLEDGSYLWAQEGSTLGRTDDRDDAYRFASQIRAAEAAIAFAPFQGFTVERAA